MPHRPGHLHGGGRGGVTDEPGGRTRDFATAGRERRGAGQRAPRHDPGLCRGWLRARRGAGRRAPRHDPRLCRGWRRAGDDTWRRAPRHDSGLCLGGWRASRHWLARLGSTRCTWRAAATQRQLGEDRSWPSWTRLARRRLPGMTGSSPTASWPTGWASCRRSSKR